MSREIKIVTTTFITATAALITSFYNGEINGIITLLVIKYLFHFLCSDVLMQ